MWDLIKYWVDKEQNPSVLAEVATALYRLPPETAATTVALNNLMFTRAVAAPGMNFVREACVHAWVRTFLLADDAESAARLKGLLDVPERFASDLQTLALAVEGYLSSTKTAISQSAFALLTRVLTSVVTAMRAIEEANSASAMWPQEAQDQYASLFRCADTACQRLYFSSGAFENQERVQSRLSPEVFYSRAAPLFTLLAGLGHPHTTHYLVDTLRYFITVDPAGVLLRMRDAVSAGAKYGYQYESMAEDRIVEIVEFYIAEHRPLLRERSDCHTALMQILDIFVRVGWPSAHQLTYRLSEIYR
jgi:hypothetical protein